VLTAFAVQRDVEHATSSRGEGTYRKLATFCEVPLMMASHGFDDFLSPTATHDDNLTHARALARPLSGVVCHFFANEFDRIKYVADDDDARPTHARPTQVNDHALVQVGGDFCCVHVTPSLVVSITVVFCGVVALTTHVMGLVHATASTLSPCVQLSGISFDHVAP
jgi:hypothetical protein